MAVSFDDKFIDVILEEFLDIENVEFCPGKTITPTENEELIEIAPSALMSIIDSLKQTNPSLLFDCENSDALNNKLSAELFKLLYTSSPYQESNAEKSWKQFHLSLDNVVNNVQAIFHIDRNFLIILLLKYFDKMVQVNIFKYEIKSQQSSVKGIDSADRDVIAYIGGSIVSKLIKKCYKNENVVSILNSLKSTVDTADITMVKVLDRGGLTYINEKATTFFVLLEICFRELYPGDYLAQNISKTIFFKKCKSNVAIRKNFWDAIVTVSSVDTFIERCMMLCLDAFFIIRAHHKCKRMMQCFLQETKCKKSKPGSKGLRSELKTLAK